MAQNQEQPRWPEPAKSSARRSVLASDLVIEGDITSSGPVDVQGIVSGQVRAPEIMIGVSGKIDGAVIAHALSVLGHISGTIDARNVSLSASAMVQADVTHERISIESGAHLEGQLKRLR
jgi:cytoskeletal protein CcmA (bactofilin family)